MSDNVACSNPMKRSVIDFTQKQAILEAVNQCGRLPSKVAKSMNLNRKSVAKVAQKGRKGYTFHDREGRPAKLDIVSIDSLRSFLLQHPQASQPDKSAAVQKEYVQQHIRLHGTDVVQVLSRRTVGRYLQRLEKEINL